jgi:DNA-directed RNA polymerase subunit RPC12/RpoP
MDVPVTIVCVDCGQTAHRLTLEPEDGWELGDYVAYRCSGCNDRWDLVVCDDDESPAESPFAAEARALLAERRRHGSQGT